MISALARYIVCMKEKGKKAWIVDDRDGAHEVKMMVWMHKA